MYKMEEDYHNNVIVASHVVFTSYNCKPQNLKYVKLLLGWSLVVFQQLRLYITGAVWVIFIPVFFLEEVI